MSPDSLTNRLLGYPADARLLIINADDFGMCHAVNTAVIGPFQAGIVRSTTLMVPCPWAHHAMHFLAGHPDQAFGVHLTVLADWDDSRWGPVTSRDKVPTVDFDFLDSYLLEPATKADRYVELLRELPAGLSEWAVHPGLSNAEFMAIDPGGHS